MSSKNLLIITNKIDQTKKDFYFGDFGTKINNKNTIKIWRNFVKAGNYNKIINKNNLIIDKKLDILTEFYCLKKSVKFRFSSKFYNFFKNLNIFRIVAHFRLVEQIMKYVRIYNPNFICFTVEGHLWENLLIEQCYNFNNKIISIGYQFTKINLNSNIFKNNFIKPSYIFCSGNIDKKILKKKFNSSKIHVLGSPKYFLTKNKNFKKKNDFLILPNANKKSLDYLINFFVNFNNKYKQEKFNFIIRCHPIMSKQNRNKIYQTISKYKNFKISNSSLNSDLKKSKFLIFDESSISLYCYKFKTIPLYFDYSKSKRKNMDYNFPKELIISSHINLKKIYEKKLSQKIKDHLRYVSKNYFIKMKKINIEKLVNE